MPYCNIMDDFFHLNTSQQTLMLLVFIGVQAAGVPTVNQGMYVNTAPSSDGMLQQQHAGFSAPPSGGEF